MEDNHLFKITPNKNFKNNHVKKLMKQSSRTRSTKTNSTQGIYLNSKSRMRYILLGSKVAADLEGTGDPKEYLLRNSSSSFGHMRPAMISPADHGLVIIYFMKEATLDPEIT